MIVRPDNLALVDLPEYALLLTQLLTLQPLVLPRLTVPVLVRVKIRSIILSDLGEVDEWTVLSMTVCIDVAVNLQGTDVSIPRFCLSVPPVFAEPSSSWDRVRASSIDRNFSDPSA